MWFWLSCMFIKMTWRRKPHVIGVWGCHVKIFVCKTTLNTCRMVKPRTHDILTKNVEKTHTMSHRSITRLPHGLETAAWYFGVTWQQSHCHVTSSNIHDNKKSRHVCKHMLYDNLNKPSHDFLLSWNIYYVIVWQPKQPIPWFFVVM